MKNILLVLILLISVQLDAQRKWFNANLESIAQYYVNDNKTGDFEEEYRFRSNNYLKFDAYLNQFTLGLQFEGYAPGSLLNFSDKLNKEIALATYFANYRSDKLDVTAGYFYEQFGNGLILRSWESRQLGLNNALRGGKISYSPFSNLHITGLYGKHRAGFDVSTGEISGFDIEFGLTDALKNQSTSIDLGFSYVNRYQYIKNAASGFNPGTNSYSGRIRFSKGNLYSNAEYVHKGKDALYTSFTLDTSTLFEGSALLLNAGYSQKGLGINATFRRLENMTFYSDREMQGNRYNDQIINYLPSLTKQHDHSLANLYIYQTQANLSFGPIQKAGEIGGQIDLYHTLKKGSVLGGRHGTKLAINYSAWYGLKADFDNTNSTYESDFWGFGEKYFTDINIELRKKWSKKWSSIFAFINIYYNRKFIEETFGEINANIAAAEATCKLSSTSSIRMEAQHLWTNEDKNNWAAGTIEISLSPRISFFAADDYNYGSKLKKIHYYSFGGNYTKGKTRIVLNYGRQRGGLLCIGGICRFVPESTGISLSLVTGI